MPPVTATTEEKRDGVDVAPSKPTIGIIYPPPEVRSILEMQCFLRAFILTYVWVQERINAHKAGISIKRVGKS